MADQVAKKRITWIDSIKGIACLIVATGHFHNGMITTTSSTFTFVVEDVLNPLINGSLMVCVFAVLSGYLSSFSIGKQSSFVKKSIRRYIQLMLPLFITGLVAFAISNLSLFVSEDTRQLFNVTDNTYLAPISFVTMITEGLYGVLFLGKATINYAFWMMRSLFVGSIMCILLNSLSFKITKFAYRLLSVIVLLGVSLVMKDHIVMSCLFGYLVGLLNVHEIGSKIRNKKFNLFVLIVIVIMACWGHHLIYVIINKYIVNLPANLDAVAKWYAFYCFFALFALCNVVKDKNILDKKCLIELGKCSMGIYCFHNIFIWTLGARLDFSLLNLNVNQDVCYCLGWIVSIACTIGFALLYERFIGESINKLLKKINL